MSLFAELIEWAIHAPDELMHRLPEDGSADIKMGAQLIVQENQVAIFIRDGKCLDQLGPGRHVLSTLNLPILTSLLSLPYGFRSPFGAAIIFVNRKVFTDLRWGTRNPVAFRDRDLGVVRLRGYGRFSLRVSDPIVFVNTLVGARGRFSVTELEDYFRDVIVSRLNDLVGEKVQSLYDLPALYNELGVAAKIRIREDVKRYGLELVEFYINSITPPEQVQAMIDERSGLQAVGGLDEFIRYEAGRSIGGHGAGGTSTAGTAVEAGLGAALGLGLVPRVLPAMGAAGSLTAPFLFPNAAGLTCPSCQAPTPLGARFCPSCGKAIPAASMCGGCEKPLPPGARFCPVCGHAAKAEGDASSTTAAGAGAASEPVAPDTGKGPGSGAGDPTGSPDTP